MADIHREDLSPRPLRRHVKVYDRGADHWRGAIVTSMVGGTATIRVLVEAAYQRTFTGPLSSVPAGAQTVGAPIVVRVVGTGATDYALAEIRESTFDGFDGPPSDMAGVIANGQVYYGIVPRDITGETELIDWDAQDRRNQQSVDAHWKAQE